MKIFSILWILFAILLMRSAFASESIGFYSNGNLENAQSVFEKNIPIQKLFVARDRLFTSDDMHEALRLASEFIKNQFPDSEILQVGDLSMKRGGFADGHSSHQNGLDGDIVYLRKNHYVQSPRSLDWDEDFVSGAGSVSKNFNTERNFAILNYLVHNTPVTRIFVDQVLKKELCSYALKNGEIKKPSVIETLRRLRPQALHRTHFHMRLGCPPNDHNCTPQSEPGEGSGCDELSIQIEMFQDDHSC
jgi:penicillin-insensitive murein endopeptidase